MSSAPANQDAGSIAIEDTPFKPIPMLTPPGEPPEKLLGRRLNAARTHYKLNAEALSRLSKSVDVHEGRGISPPSIARYESGESLPGARELRLLGQALGVSMDWLVFGTVTEGGKSDAEQQLIDALRRLISTQQADINVGGVPVSETIAYISGQQRIKALQDARKPQQP